jgi:hypothetical protein
MHLEYIWQAILLGALLGLFLRVLLWCGDTPDRRAARQARKEKS